MDRKKDLLWQAYLDGELSVSETSDFESSLTEDERERLAAEMQFEGGLAERLSRDAKCPEDVWERTKALITEGRDVEPQPRSLRRWYWGAASLAAAAAVAFMISVYAPVQPSTSSALVLAAETVEDLAATTETEAGREAAQAYLDSHDVALHINPVESLSIASTHHNIEVLGTRTAYAAGEPVVEVLLSCCGRPVKVVMAAQGSAAAQEIGYAAGGNSQVRATRSVDGYLAAVVGDHTPHELLDIVGRQ